MRFGPFLILSLIPFISHAQLDYFEGSVQDMHSGLPMSDVHIFDINGDLRAVSDHFGDFLLPYFDHDTVITASCIGYKTISVPISSILDDAVIYMVEDTLQLSEITISPLGAREIMCRSIEKIDENYLYEDIELSGTFNFIVRKEDKVVFTKKDSAMHVVMDGSEFDLRISDQSPLMSYTSTDTITNIIFGDFEGNLKDIFDFDHIIRKRGFFNVSNLDQWDLKIQGYTVIDNTNLIIISAKFIDPKGKLYHTAEIYINEQDFGVLKVDFSYEWMIRNLKPTKDFSLWIDDVKWQGRANYIKQDGKYQVSNLEYLHEKHAFTKDWRNRYKDLARYIVQSNFTNSCSKNTQ